MDKYTFGNNLYKLRTEKGLTQKDLAKILNVSDKAVSKWETGDALPRVKTLEMIADCFSVSYEKLLSEEITDETLPQHEYEQYKKFYDERLSSEFKKLRHNLIVSFILIFVAIFANFIGAVTQISSGYITTTLHQTITFIVFPFVALFAFCILCSLYSKNYSPESTKQRFILFGLCVISGTLTTIRYLLSEDFTFITVLGFAIPTLVLLIFFVYSKRKSNREPLWISNTTLFHLTNYTPFISALFVLLLDFNIVSFITMLLYGSVITTLLALYKLQDIDNGLSKVIEIKKTQNTKSKKILTIAATLTVIFSLILSMLFTLVPGISVKIAFSDSDTANKKAILFEDYNTKLDMTDVQEILVKDLKIFVPSEYSITQPMENAYMCMVNEQYTLTVHAKKQDNEDIKTGEDFIFDDSIPEQERSLLKRMFISTFGKFPENNFEYYKLIHSISIDDINIFNYSQCASYSMLMVSKAIFTNNATDILIYEKDNIGAIITVRPLEDDKLLYTVDLYKKDNDEYYYTLLYKEDSVETFYKILNSIEVIN